jgi:hypothetical protein
MSSTDSVNALLRRVDQAIANAKLNLNNDQDGGKKKRRRRRSKSVNKLLTEFNGGEPDEERFDLLSGGKRSKKSKASKKTKKTKKSKKSKKSKKMGRGANTFIADMSALRTYIKTKLSKPLNHLSLTENDKNLDKAKKAFNETEFMKLYNKCDKERNENKASKK